MLGSQRVWRFSTWLCSRCFTINVKLHAVVWVDVGHTTRAVLDSVCTFATNKQGDICPADHCGEKYHHHCLDKYKTQRRQVDRVCPKCSAAFDRDGVFLASQNWFRFGVLFWNGCKGTVIFHWIGRLIPLKKIKAAGRGRGAIVVYCADTDAYFPRGKVWIIFNLECAVWSP
jgi:hypothetical protein